ASRARGPGDVPAACRDSLHVGCVTKVTFLKNKGLPAWSISCLNPCRRFQRGGSSIREWLMGKFRKTIGRLFAGLAVAASLGIAAPAKSDVIQLGFIIDESGSIGSSNYTIIK